MDEVNKKIVFFQKNHQAALFREKMIARK